MCCTVRVSTARPESELSTAGADPALFHELAAPGQAASRRRQVDELAVVPGYTVAAHAPNSRMALSAMVSKTGWTSACGLADHPEDLRGGGLAIEGVGQVVVARLQLREQAHVLDGDHGLVGEGLEEPDLLLGEGKDLHAANQDCPEGHTLAE